MRKFGVVYKEKQNKAVTLHETHILTDFKKIYNSLLEHYSLNTINDLNEKSQVSFLTELSKYWTEEKGLNEDGRNFLKKRSMRLTESSTPLQKKNFLKKKTTTLLNELMRQGDFKYKIYSVLDEMYSQTNGKNISDVLSPNMISNILSESLALSLNDLISDIHLELNESSKPKSKKQKVYIRKRK